VPTINEYFLDCNDPSISSEERIARFKKKYPEYNKLTGASDLFNIALSVESGKYTLEERLAAYDQYLQVTGVSVNKSIIQIIIDYAEAFK
jgi:hypothetical protein